MNGTYVFVVVDNAGNTIEKTVVVDKIDTEAPVVTLNDAPTEWTNSFTLNINAQDLGAGVETIKVNGVVINRTTYEITDNGTYIVVVIDALGNTTEKTIVVNKIDNELPTLEVSEAPSEWVKEHTFTVNAADTLSGVKEITVNGVVINSTTYKVTVNGTYVFVVIDNMGNRVEKTIVVDKIDTDAPAIEVSDAPATWVTEHTFTVNATDALAGVKEITVNGVVINSTTYKVTVNGTYVFVVVDNAGNTIEKTIVVDKIDTEAPVFGGEIAGSAAQADSITVTLPSATDDSNEALTYELYLNGVKVDAYTGGASHTFTGLTVGTNYTVKLVVTDIVGRTTTIEKVFTTTGLAKVEVAVDVSGLGINAETMHINVYLGDKVLPVGNDGKVVFENIAEGTYAVTFKAAGFFTVAKEEITVANGEVKAVEFKKEEIIAGDSTADGVIDLYDLNAVASAFTNSYEGETNLKFDFNRDGKVNKDDVKILIANFNKVYAE